jgi:single-strand DNA-binding protein
MSSNFNKVVLIGNLTKDNIVRKVGEKTVCNGSIAVNRFFKSSTGEKKSEVCYISYEAWEGRAEVLEKFTKKGSPVLIEGRLKNSNWVSKEGEKRSQLVVVVDNLQLLGKKEEGNSEDVVPEAPEAAAVGADAPPF